MECNKFEPGDIIVKVDIAIYSSYARYFTIGKEYTIVSGNEISRNIGEIYVMCDEETYIMVYPKHFKISLRTQRKETINDILS